MSYSYRRPDEDWEREWGFWTGPEGEQKGVVSTALLAPGAKAAILLKCVLTLLSRHIFVSFMPLQQGLECALFLICRATGDFKTLSQSTLIRYWAASGLKLICSSLSPPGTYQANSAETYKMLKKVFDGGLTPPSKWAVCMWAVRYLFAWRNCGRKKLKSFGLGHCFMWQDCVAYVVHTCTWTGSYSGAHDC